MDHRSDQRKGHIDIEDKALAVSALEKRTHHEHNTQTPSNRISPSATPSSGFGCPVFATTARYKRSATAFQ